MPTLQNGLRIGGDLLSIAETARTLNITRVTLYRWISMGLIRPTGHEVIGGRHNYWFEPAYIERINSLLTKKRKRGTPILTRDIEQKMKALL